MTEADTLLLEPFLFDVDADALADRYFYRYCVPVAAYQELVTAQLEAGTISKKKESAHEYEPVKACIDGLAAVVAWAAPAVDKISVQRPDTGGRPTADGVNDITICFWMIAPIGEEDALIAELERALDIWLGWVLEPDAYKRVRRQFERRGKARQPFDRFSIGTSLRANAVCASPHDPNLFDLVTLYAARRLEGHVINTGTEHQGELVMSGPIGSLFSGKKLMRFHPSRRDGKTEGACWTEVFSICAITTPGCKTLRVGVNVHIRNFRAIEAKYLSGSENRMMDIVMPSDPVLSGGVRRLRTFSLALRRSDWIAASQKKPSYDVRVMSQMLRIAGIAESWPTIREGAIPVAEPGVRHGFYPRMGANHGDRFMPGGTGIPAPDRIDYLAVLDDAFGPAGLHRVRMAKRARMTVRCLKEAQTVYSDTDSAALRAAVAFTCRSYKHENGLWISHFSNDPQAATWMTAAAEQLLGEPASRENVGPGICRLQYKDDFAVTIEALDAGPMAELLPEVTLNPADANMTSEMRAAKERSLRQQAEQQRGQALREHIAKSAHQTGSAWVSCVEMPEDLRQHPRRDPYLLNYAALGAAGSMVQTKFLMNSVAMEGKTDDDSEVKKETAKYKNSVLDMLRSIGVAAIRTPDIRLGAWHLINRNGVSAYNRRPGELDRIVTPIYAECVKGNLVVAMLNEKREVAWMSYPQAVINIGLKRVANLKSLKRPELISTVEQFFAEVTPDDDIPTVIFTEATNIRQAVPGLSNDKLSPLGLSLGAVGASAPKRTIGSAGTVSIVRLTNESAKAVSYASSNRGGYARGVFQEEEASSVFWLTRGLPDPLQMSVKFTNPNSRINPPEAVGNASRFGNRRMPLLSEVCMVVQGKTWSADELAAITRFALGSHITTDDATRLPFPLHEVSLLR